MRPPSPLREQVHLIDTVLVPKQMAQRAAAWAAAPPTKNIVQLAQSVPDLSVREGAPKRALAHVASPGGNVHAVCAPEGPRSWRVAHLATASSS